MCTLYGYLINILNFIRDNSATIIALCALTLTLFQAYISRKHNRLAVRPSLTASTYAEHLPPNRYVCEVTLINAGLGPGIVDDYIIVYEGEHYYFTNHEQFYSLIYNDIFPENCVSEDDHFYLYRYGSVIPAGENQNILKITFYYRDEADLYSLKGKINKFVLKINYHSMYGEKLTYDTSYHLRSKK